MAQDYKEARRRIGVDLWKSTLNCIVRGGKHWFSSSFFILLCNVLMACFHYSNCFWLVLLLLLLFVCGKCPFIMVQWVGARRYKVSKNFLPSQHWTHTHYIFIHIYCKLRWKVVAVMCAGGCVLQYVCIERQLFGFLSKQWQAVCRIARQMCMCGQMAYMKTFQYVERR